MENIERINLSDFQKREILEIYKKGIGERKDATYIKREIRSKLNSYAINYNERQVQLIFDDCKMHVLLKDLFSVYENKDYSGLVHGKEEIIRFAKYYIIKKYSEMSLEDLEDRDVISTIFNRIHKKEFARINNRQMVEDIINLVRDKLEIKSDLSKEDIIEFFENKKGTYEIFLQLYIERLLQKGQYETSIEQENLESIEDSVPENKTNDYIKKIEERRDLLVTDEEAQDLLMSEPIAIELAEDYVYNPDGNRRIENSLVEDRLITMYLATRKRRNL